MGDSPFAIRAVGLRKTYRTATGEVHAVSGVDLTVERGRFFGLLGPNGAGKSTAIGMLTTRVRPTAGTAQVAGADVLGEPVEVKRRIGVVSQTNTLDRGLSVHENLEFSGRFFGLRAAAARARATELLTTFDLAGRARARPSELSGGQAQRVMIARALMHGPEVLFLDEPTTGIDPQSRLKLWEVLRDLHASGHTVLLTTHHLEEAEALCERIAIVDGGTVLATGTVEELGHGIGAGTEVVCGYDGDAAPVVATLLAARSDLRLATSDGRRLRVRAASPEGLVGTLVEAGTAHGLTVLDLTTRRTSLEDVFLELTGRAYRGQ